MRVVSIPCAVAYRQLASGRPLTSTWPSIDFSNSLPQARHMLLHKLRIWYHCDARQAKNRAMQGVRQRGSIWPMQPWFKIHSGDRLKRICFGIRDFLPERLQFKACQPQPQHISTLLFAGVNVNVCKPDGYNPEKIDGPYANSERCNMESTAQTAANIDHAMSRNIECSVSLRSGLSF
jgi:hypothetical protein